MKYKFEIKTAKKTWENKCNYCKRLKNTASWMHGMRYEFHHNGNKDIDCQEEEIIEAFEEKNNPEIIQFNIINQEVSQGAFSMMANKFKKLIAPSNKNIQKLLICENCIYALCSLYKKNFLSGKNKISNFFGYNDSTDAINFIDIINNNENQETHDNHIISKMTMVQKSDKLYNVKWGSVKKVFLKRNKDGSLDMRYKENRN